MIMNILIFKNLGAKILIQEEREANSKPRKKNRFGIYNVTTL
jgi:hypothetical protein